MRLNNANYLGINMTVIEFICGMQMWTFQEFYAKYNSFTLSFIANVSDITKILDYVFFYFILTTDCSLWETYCLYFSYYWRRFISRNHIVSRLFLMTRIKLTHVKNMCVIKARKGLQDYVELRRNENVLAVDLYHFLGILGFDTREDFIISWKTSVTKRKSTCRSEKRT